MGKQNFGLQPLETKEQSQIQISHATHGLHMSTWKNKELRTPSIKRAEDVLPTMKFPRNFKTGRTRFENNALSITIERWLISKAC